MSQQISPLRQRMIEDMTIRNMSPSTQKIYVAAVANFSIFHGRSRQAHVRRRARLSTSPHIAGAQAKLDQPDYGRPAILLPHDTGTEGRIRADSLRAQVRLLTFEDVRDYRLHLISRGLKPNSINPIMGALRFFYRTTLGLKDVSEQIPYARRSDPLPAVLAREEVVRFLKAVPDLRMRTLFITIYAAGLRVSEAVKLSASDIDSARMVLAIRQTKGRKDRYVMLSEQLLGILRDYWKQAHLEHLLFPGPDPSRPITTRSVERACRRVAEAAGLDKSITVHTLRHSFATHLLEQGVDIHVIQDLLGHRNIASTTRYARVAINTIRQIQSPLELLNMEVAAPT